MAHLHAQEVIADRDLVSQLSRKSFASRTVAEQKHIVSSVNFTALSCDSVNLNGVWFVWA